MRFPLSLTTSLSRYLIKQKLLGRKRFPLVLMLEPTHACNLYCDGCGRIRTWYEGQKAELSLDECVGAVKECPAPVVSICGGEPLMFKPLPELVQATLDLGRHIYLCTNGMLLNRFVEKVKPHPHLIVNIHFDGTRAFHDEVVKKEGCFEDAFEGAKLAKEHGFTVCTNTTVFRQTEIPMLEKLYRKLEDIGVDGFLISPAYSYSAVAEKEHFMTRDEIRDKFRSADGILSNPKFWNTPIYMDFLLGNRELECTPWGNPTRDPYGWKKPCYLMEDGHYETFEELMRETAWESYGPGNDPRCEDCLVHCGFEPTATRETQRNLKDGLRMLKWNFS